MNQTCSLSSLRINTNMADQAPIQKPNLSHKFQTLMSSLDTLLSLQTTPQEPTVQSPITWTGIFDMASQLTSVPVEDLVREYITILDETLDKRPSRSSLPSPKSRHSLKRRFTEIADDNDAELPQPKRRKLSKLTIMRIPRKKPTLTPLRTRLLTRMTLKEAMTMERSCCWWQCWKTWGFSC